MQEQLCRNKILVEMDPKLEILTSSCASSTLETKSKIHILIKNNQLVLKSSSFKEMIPLTIILKAMGVPNDKSICDLLNPFFNETE
jgi:DNA-directed RNA polymerase beta subunit